jgi:hypothetical protein
MKEILNLSEKIGFIADRSLILCLLKKSSDFFCRRINPNIDKDYIFRFTELVATASICGEFFNSANLFVNYNSLSDREIDNKFLNLTFTSLFAGVAYSYLTSDKFKLNSELKFYQDATSPSSEVKKIIVDQVNLLKSSHNKKTKIEKIKNGEFAKIVIELSKEKNFSPIEAILGL